MTTATIPESLKEQIVPILKKHGVIRAGIFGRFARGEQRADSDVDILIDVPAGFSLLNLAALEIDIEDTIGRAVDLVTYRSIHPLLRESILGDEVELY